LKERNVLGVYNMRVDVDEFDFQKGKENMKKFYLNRIPIPESELVKKIPSNNINKDLDYEELDLSTSRGESQDADNAI
jgi:hypothetical protein